MAQAQPQFPPVPGNDVQQKGYGLWQNTGWVIDTDSQLREDVLFVSEGGLPRIFVRKEASMSFTHAVLDTAFGGTDTLRRLDMTVVGAEALYPDALGSSAKVEERHFYLPHCGPTGVTNVVGYSRIVYPNVYPLIDLWVFSGTLGQKVMFVIWPGADPKDIELEFTGQNELLVDFAGWLRMLLADEWISLPQPVAYQFDSLNTILPLPWTVEYEPQGNSGIVTLEYDTYDPAMPLVFLIGPPPMGGMSQEVMGLCWSTYLGGDGSDEVNDVETDAFGNVFFSGYSSSSYQLFPANAGLQFAQAGNRVAFLSKFSSDFQPEWSLFIGGDVFAPTFTTASSVSISDGADQRIFIGGVTTSNDFFTVPNGNAYYDNEYTGTAPQGTGFLAEFNAFGIVHWSTYFGDERTSVTGMDVIPGTNALVICGRALDYLPEPQLTPPTGSLNWPYAGAEDAYIAAFDAAGQLYWRSWWGGEFADWPVSVQATSEKIVMAGTTDSPDIEMVFPGGGAYFDNVKDGNDCFIIEFNPFGVVQWSTYLGGFAQDYPGDDGLYIGPGGDVFLSGFTTSSNLDMVPGPNWHDEEWDPQSSGFIARFRAIDRSPLWLTYFGHGNVQTIASIVQDPAPSLAIHIAGSSTGEGAPLTPFAPAYNQGQLMEIAQGSFFASFSNIQELEHMTWFGGAATTNITSIHALEPHHMGTLAVGLHEKYWNALAYFPLDDGQGNAWCDPLYNNQALSVLGTDGFVTLFCSELSVGAPSNPSASGASLSAMHQPGEVLLIGNRLEGLAYGVYDTMGRSLQTGELQRTGDRMAIRAPELPRGAYLVRLQDGRTAKFIVP